MEYDFIINQKQITTRNVIETDNKTFVGFERNVAEMTGKKILGIGLSWTMSLDSWHYTSLLNSILNSTEEINMFYPKFPHSSDSSNINYSQQKFIFTRPSNNLSLILSTST